MQIKKILKQLSKAKTCLLAGGGISYAEAAAELKWICRTLPNSSGVTSLLGQGTIATSHPLFLGMGGYARFFCS